MVGVDDIDTVYITVKKPVALGWLFITHWNEVLSNVRGTLLMDNELSIRFRVYWSKSKKSDQ